MNRSVWCFFLLFTIAAVQAADECTCKVAMNSSSSQLACQRRFTVVLGYLNYTTLSLTAPSTEDNLTESDFHQLTSTQVCNHRFRPLSLFTDDGFITHNDNSTTRLFRYRLEFVRDIPPGLAEVKEEEVENSTRRIEEKLLAGLGSDRFVRRIFGGEEGLLTGAEINIDECLSSLAKCTEKTVCLDQTNGYECPYNYCLMSVAPPEPLLGTRRVVFPPGIEPNETYGELEEAPIGTGIIYACKTYYAVHKDGKWKPGYPPLTCRLQVGWIGSDGMWPPTRATCLISFGFRAALIASAVSGAVILFVTSCLSVNCCRRTHDNYYYDIDDDVEEGTVDDCDDYGYEDYLQHGKNAILH